MTQETSGFFVTLLSSASSEIYPDNNAANFTVKLGKEISLQGEWEVALVQYSFRKSFTNIPQHQVNFTYYPNETDQEVDLLAAMAPTSVIQEPIYLGTADEFCKYVTDKMEECYSLIDFTNTFKLERKASISQTDGKITITPGIIKSQDSAKTYQIIHKPSFRDGMGLIYTMIGFNAQAWEIDNSSPVTGTRFDPEIGNRMIFVYSNVCDYSRVGDSYTPLLRVLINYSDHKREETTSAPISHPLYVRVCQKRFESINISMHNQFGQRLKFYAGESFFTLHFRPVR